MPDNLRPLHSKLGGLVTISRYGRDEVAGRARRAFLARFANAADPDAALRAYMLRLAIASAKARAARKAGRP